MSFQLLEWVSLLASIIAFEHQMLENLFHDFVWGTEYGHFVTNTALEFVLVRVALARSGSEISDAFTAATGGAVWALDHILFDRHAKGAFNIFHERLEFVSSIKVLNF